MARIKIGLCELVGDDREGAAASEEDPPKMFQDKRPLVILEGVEVVGVRSFAAPVLVVAKIECMRGNRSRDNRNRSACSNQRHVGEEEEEAVLLCLDALPEAAAAAVGRLNTVLCSEYSTMECGTIIATNCCDRSS